MDLKNQIEALANRLIDDESLFVAGVEVSNKTGGKVSVLLGGDEGVTIEQCASLSRQLGAIMEEQEMIEHAYTLEVSSCGVDYPLQNERHYRTNIGRRLEIEMRGEEKPVIGKLLSVENGILQIDKEVKKIKYKVKTEKVAIPIAEIETARVLVSFS